ncbi:MAG: hypothetical protein Q8L24_01660 [bacterium]|nr:hypothetical protein [bacterium]
MLSIPVRHCEDQKIRGNLTEELFINSINVRLLLRRLADCND